MEPNLSVAASLIADPARGEMLAALLDGRALPAGELARVAGVTAQTASSHLSKMLAGGLLAVESQGRHRYYRLAGPHVAEAMEHLAAIRPAEPARPRAPHARTEGLRVARCCYDHLAGRVGVAVTRSLQAREIIVAAPDKRFEVTPAGVAWFSDLGLDVTTLKSGRRGLARQCLDWTERTPHLAGPLGVQLLRLLCAKGWLRRAPGSRAVRITPRGHRELKRRFGLDDDSLGHARVVRAPRPRRPQPAAKACS